jgi:hypothetical protein
MNLIIMAKDKGWAFPEVRHDITSCPSENEKGRKKLLKMKMIQQLLVKNDLTSDIVARVMETSVDGPMLEAIAGLWSAQVLTRETMESLEEEVASGELDEGTYLYFATGIHTVHRLQEALRRGIPVAT